MTSIRERLCEWGYERVGTALLVGATGVVGVSIAAGGEVGRVLNGVGGLSWFAAAGFMVAAAGQRERRSWQWPAAIALTGAVAFVIKPTDATLAIAGFGVAGAIMGLVVERDPVLWAKLIPALYLPAHIGTALLKVAAREVLGLEASVRTQPPPIAFAVPAIMVAAAWVGGYLAVVIRQRRSPGPSAKAGERAADRA
jgi:hypothetical protein